MSAQDRIFFKNFALLIAGMMVFTVVIIFAAIQLNDEATRPDDPNVTARLEERIAPVGQVYSGETGMAAIAAAKAAAAAAQPVAFDGALDGELIYNQVCAACHDAGVAGSPRLEQAAWDSRIAQGMDVMVTHAIEGYQGEAGVMPAKGGRTDLTDEQVEVTVQWMVDNLQ